MTLVETKVLITCSGLGSRLGEITQYTNKSLVRIGNKPAISHIIAQYPKETQFVITLGHFGDHIRQYLNIAHPNRHFEFVEVDLYDGPGSSLGRSMHCAKNLLPGSFVFHAGDTITDGTVPQENQNSLWVSSGVQDSSQYRTVRSSGKDVRIILEKGESSSDAVYIGKCYISNADTFWKCLEEMLADKKYKSELSDCHVINKMLKAGCKFRTFHARQWFDVGNLDSLRKTRKELGGNINVLDKPNESIFFIDDFVIKFFSDRDVLSKRVERAKILSPYVTEITHHSHNFMKYHYEKGDVLSRIRNFNADMLSSLLTWTNNRLWKLKKEKENPENFKHLCRSFYYDKTISRVEMFMRQRNDRDTAHIINGVNVPDVETLLEYAEKDSLFEGVCGKIHGDFILENIVRTEDESFMLIDWRQDFAGDLHSGDVYYDLAKLNHNLYVNHDIIRNGGFTCEINSTGGIYVDLHCAHRFVAAQKEIEKFCQRHNLSHKKVKMLSSIIWINMSPLHDKRFGDFLFYFGKLQLHNLTHEQ